MGQTPSRDVEASGSTMPTRGRNNPPKDTTSSIMPPPTNQDISVLRLSTASIARDTKTTRSTRRHALRLDLFPVEITLIICKYLHSLTDLCMLCFASDHVEAVFKENSLRMASAAVWRHKNHGQIWDALTMRWNIEWTRENAYSGSQMEKRLYASTFRGRVPRQIQGDRMNLVQDLWVADGMTDDARCFFTKYLLRLQSSAVVYAQSRKGRDGICPSRCMGFEYYSKWNLMGQVSKAEIQRVYRALWRAEDLWLLVENEIKANASWGDSLKEKVYQYLSSIPDWELVELQTILDFLVDETPKGIEFWLLANLTKAHFDRREPANLPHLDQTHSLPTAATPNSDEHQYVPGSTTCQCTTTTQGPTSTLRQTFGCGDCAGRPSPGWQYFLALRRQAPTHAPDLSRPYRDLGIAIWDAGRMRGLGLWNAAWLDDAKFSWHDKIDFFSVEWPLWMRGNRRNRPVHKPARWLAESQLEYFEEARLLWLPAKYSLVDGD